MIIMHDRHVSGSSSTTVSIRESNSDQGLVAVSSRAALYKRSVVIWRILILALIVLLLLVIALSLALAIVTSRRPMTAVSVCTSHQCVKAASNLIESMDTSVDPCSDFYKYACGQWGGAHPIPDTNINQDWFMDRATHTARMIRGYLKANVSDDDPSAIVKAKVMYRACMDVQRLEELGLDPMFEVLYKVGVDLPVLTEATGGPPPISLLDAIVRAKLVMDQDLLIGFAVYPDPKNGTINRLTVGKPSGEYPLPRFHEMEKMMKRRRREEAEDGSSSDSGLMRAYIRYMSAVMRYCFLWKKRTVSSRQVTAVAEHIQEFEYEMYRITHPDTADDFDVDYMSLQELQKYTDNITLPHVKVDWRHFFTAMYAGVNNVTLDLDGGDVVMVHDMDYLSSLLQLLVNTNNVTLHNYMWWQLIDTMAPHMNHDMRDMREHYLEEVTDGTGPLSRSAFCTNVVTEMMGMAVSYFLAEPAFLNTTRLKVEQMVSDVQWAFHTFVDQLQWMDADTKVSTREKAQSTLRFIGFPEWLLDASKLDDYYYDVDINESTHLQNMLGIRSVTVNSMLESLRIFNSREDWFTDPVVVNAFHTFQANAVTVPLGILQFPFYHLGLEALNYGALGSILGHELTHGFDDEGRKYDKEGNMRSWWTNTTVDEYVNRTQCLVKQYSTYHVGDLDTPVNGKLTLGENIADNGGVREAFHAYHHFRDRNGVEPGLPGLEGYTDEQLFFLSFANVWCEAYTKQSLQYDLTDGHSPNVVRVWGSLTNSPEFARVWDCPTGTFMHPSEDKCIIW